MYSPFFPIEAFYCYSRKIDLPIEPLCLDHVQSQPVDQIKLNCLDGGGGGVQGVLWEMCKWRMSVFQRDHK